MKKTYMQPELNVVKLGLVQMMCSSPTGTLDSSKSITNENQFGARGFDFDFEDDEE